MNSHSSHTPEPTAHSLHRCSGRRSGLPEYFPNGSQTYELPPIPGPKYEQVIHYLEQRYVIPGKPGGKLPTERTIQQNFGVSLPDGA